MKNVFFTLVLFIGFIGTAAAQQTQAVKVGPLGFLFGNYNLRYERALTEKTSFQVGANFYNYELLDLGTTGFGIDAGWRYYFREAIEGAYVFPSAGYDFNSTTISSVDDTKVSFSNLGIGATVGYQWVSGGGFLVDLGLGYGYNINVTRGDGLADDRDVNDGGSVRFTFALGYAF
jgi:hypothetical protein